MDHFFHTFADPDFYEDIARWRCPPDDPRFRRIRRGPASVAYADGWQYTRHGIWTVCSPGQEPLGKQGWKLHIAVTPESFPALLEKVSGFCFSRRVRFKFLARYEYAWLVNAKYAPRPVSGKGIVLYPADEDLSVALARELTESLRDARGPRILSDLQLDDTVVHARYGAYTRRYCRDAVGKVAFALEDPDGRLVPDRRSVPFAAPPFVVVPDAFKARRPTAEGPLPPYRVDKTLHFSNSGGVYLATNLDDDRQVVLKEARPHAGYDLVGGDAVRRAVREYEAMRRFADLPEVPEAYDQFTWQSHLFTAMEYVQGATLQEWCAAHQPFLLRSDPFAPPAPEEVQDYREKVEVMLVRLRKVLGALWKRGYIFGDIHPGNVMVTPELDVRLLDLEACLPETEARPFPGAPGFSDPARSGRDADEYALGMLELSCYLPLTHLARMDGTKLRQLTEVARSRFGLSRSWADRIAGIDPTPAAAHPHDGRPAGSASSSHVEEALGFEAWAARIVAGLKSVMDDHRPDRLFPCDHTGFALSPVSLATGAAGVLWALLGTEDLGIQPSSDGADCREFVTALELEGLNERITNWIVTQGRASAGRLECGLYDSGLGAGYTLWRAGRTEHAQWLVDAALARDRASCGLSLFSGLAGIYLAVAEMSGAARPPGVADRDVPRPPLVPVSLAEEMGAELAERADRFAIRLRKAGSRDVSQYGLMHGVAGVALAVHRYGRLVGDGSALRLAQELLELEFAAYVRCVDGSLQFNEAERRTLGYLEVGSCGSALVLAELTQDGSWQPSHASIPDLMRALGPELMVQSGLFRGRAGFLAGLTSLSGAGHGERATALVDRHVRQLGLHEIRARGGGLHYPGSGNFKLSCDLRTGSAGVLTGVAFATRRRTDWLPGVA
ncbi:class III lanthionine synthetase LanKC [Streptomyces natalensis]|uniref:Protein kinase domain-containing protein n=1 Tax=Streptomyces natalensis ATCC 27448 TaxID=1240678 RepID=A0A0D7CVX9_9ACTN|nr:class III lanthionine synthetase LanKC [Streptomyces natalensis]KIZ19542.1 hypothetical protein SNA_03290 [Streptomyces natalensis ATCC 27448]